MSNYPANTPASGGDDRAAIAAARDEYERWSTAYSSGEPQGRRAWVCRHDDDGQWRPTTYHGSEGEASDACHEEALAASVRAALAAQPPKPDGGVVPADPLVAYLERQWSWSKETFGPALRTKGIVQHITKELREIEADPHDLAEWVDVIILAMDGFWRHGGKPTDLLPAMQAKQDRNFARTWPDWRTMGEDQAIEHDRSGEAAPPLNTGPEAGGGGHLGYIFHNPDTGTEWSENHPVESGECDDAADIRSATLEVLHAELISAWSSEAAGREDCERLRKQRLDQIDYGVALQRIIEALCHGHDLPADGETKAPHHYAMAKSSRPTPAEAGEDLAGLSARATPGLAIAEMDSFKLRVGPPGSTCGNDLTTVALCSTCDRAHANLVFLAELWNAYRSGRLTPAASRPAEQGDPVAWAFEYAMTTDTVFTDWLRGVEFEKPSGSQFLKLRDVRPLYTHPAPAASRPAGREEIARVINPEAFQHGSPDYYGPDEVAAWCSAGQRIALRRADQILRLISSPRDDARAGGDQEGGWLPIAEKPDDPDVYVHLPDGEVAGLGWATDVDDRLVYLLWWQEVSPGRSDVTHFRKTIAGPPSLAPETRGDTRDGGVT